MNFKLIIISLFIISFTIVASADAYIDPNTGGIFFQTVLPLVYAMLGAIVVFWKRIVAFFKGLFGNKKDQNNS
ncbi:MAG TPA: hypothetical protein ENG95_04850 [Nitrospirae bacterium]|nr:hypothetical protein [Nitrospirota bacterium]